MTASMSPPPDTTGSRMDVTIAARDTDHADLLVEAMRSVPGAVIGKVSDRTFPEQLGGKIEMAAKQSDPQPRRPGDALHPGVARVSMAIATRTQPTPVDSPSNATAWP